MKLELATKWKDMPRNANGDVEFKYIGPAPENEAKGLRDFFTMAEIVELCNRALYQLEYQANAHRKYGAVKRQTEKRLREALKAAGVDPKQQKVKDELEGK